MTKDNTIPATAAKTTKAITSRQPSKKLRKQVRDAFDAEMLAYICVETDFSYYGERHDLSADKDGHERFYYYQDNGSDILAIAHLDTVQGDRTCQVIDTAAGLLATSGALDDRLGAYVILEMLPKLGIECDWLLTTDEEICATTAMDFYPDKEYNWMFSFDRGGTDVVMYEYETPELKGLVEDAGAQVGVGSYSDICELEHLGCAGFNWGVGYREYHSPRAHAWLDDTFRMVARFVKFYNTNANDALAHEPAWKTAVVKWDDDRWNVSGSKWDEEWIVVADCGHDVDMDNPATYVDQGPIFVCTPCGTIHER